MTRKDFEALAVVAGSMLLPLPLHDRLVNKLAEVCESRNPRFSKGSFTCAAAAARGSVEPMRFNDCRDCALLVPCLRDEQHSTAESAVFAANLTVEGGE